MLTLSNDAGDLLQIWIEDYQYPDPDGYFWDLNWLNVTVRWQRGTEIWQASDPCLSTEELLELQAWLNEIQSDTTGHSNIGFMEPCLRFEWRQVNSMPMLSICLSSELDPRRSDKLPDIMQKTGMPSHDEDAHSGYGLSFPLQPLTYTILCRP
ncbi:WapI family immunity protein [Methylomonas koyamae]|uniref:WapI family immunity protein n=1 Tax=Methylomonas koyamae TaxID=702114 RepID=UPI0006D0601F|nr:hypothetical protein [Methylomonas koyamae]